MLDPMRTRLMIWKTDGKIGLDMRFPKCLSCIAHTPQLVLESDLRAAECRAESFAVERLCGPSGEKDKNAAVFPPELKSQLTLKAVSADPSWKFDVFFAKRTKDVMRGCGIVNKDAENLSKIIQKRCKPLSLPPSFYGVGRLVRKRPLPCDTYSCDSAKCPRCWLTEHGDSVEVFTELASALCDTFLKAESPKRMRMTERLGSLLMAFEPTSKSLG